MKLIAATALAGLLAIPLAAQETRNCAPRGNVLDRLAQGYGETRQSIGLGGGGVVVEVFASEVTGSWSITVTHPNGMTCLVASGEGFEDLNEPSGEPA